MILETTCAMSPTLWALIPDSRDWRFKVIKKIHIFYVKLLTPIASSKEEGLSEEGKKLFLCKFNAVLRVYITAMGLAVGLSVGLFFLGLFILVSVCAVLFFLWQGS